ncbi:hypothetical protein BH18ACT10_BH18ACT10_07890 [soil metagenome]
MPDSGRASTWGLGMAGFCAIAVSFGPARAGYGLFLPDFREEFGLSIGMSGLIASGLQAGYLVALTVVGLLVARVGPRPLVVLGGLAAAGGMALVAATPVASLLAVGVIVAGTSAGWSWAPYNDAVDGAVPQRLQGRVLSVISTGTTFGVLAAGVAALAAGPDWRVGWLAFAAAGLIAAAINHRVLPAGLASGRAEVPAGRARLARLSAGPLFGVAFAFGGISAFYWAFAVDLVSRSTQVAFETGPVFYMVVGFVGFAGVFTGDAVARFGFSRVLLGTSLSLCAACVLLAFGAGSLPASGASAALYGVGVMTMSSLLAIWSSLVFHEQPSTGFSATLFAFGVGCVAGPATLGAYAERYGLDAAFLVSAAVLLPTAVAAVFPPDGDSPTV